MSITIQEVKKDYGPIRALDGVSFSAARDQVFGILGSNGAGKTTLLKIITTLTRPSGGRVLIDGTDAFSRPRRTRRSFGLVFQESSLDVRLTARENLYLHGLLYGMSVPGIKRGIEEALDFVGLRDRGDNLVRTLSGGMRRRLELARALMHGPHFLILDEPTAGLDPRTRARMWELLRDLKWERGITALVATHYLAEAENCDRLVILDKGRLVVEGTPEELRRALGREVIRLRARDPVRLAAILHGSFRLPFNHQGEDFFITSEGGTSMIGRLLGRFPHEVVSVEMRPPTLEDVFLHFTGKETGDEGEEEGSQAFLRRRVQ